MSAGNHPLKIKLIGIVADLTRQDSAIQNNALRRLHGLGPPAIGPLLLLFGERFCERRGAENEFRSRFLHVRIRALAVSVAVVLASGLSLDWRIALLAAGIAILFVFGYGILCSPEQFYFPVWQKAAINGLDSLMRSHRLDKGGRLTQNELVGLYAILGCCSKPGEELYRPELAASILWELPKVADGRAVDLVRALAAEGNFEDLHPVLVRAARTCLPDLEAILEAEKRGETLLRPAGSDTTTDSLVRPAQSVASRADELLHPAEAEDQETRHAS